MIKPKIVLIVAGGKGERMQADVPKQFIEIQGKPILMHTIETFKRYDSSLQIILVLPVNQIDLWNQLCKKHAFSIKHTIIEGGSTRFLSVKNGLKAVNVPALVAVHDGVRPLVSVATISRCFEAAALYGAVIPVVNSMDSIRQITETGNQSVDRNEYKLVQTPQVFDARLLKEAYEQEYSTLFTDDASVVETLGMRIQLVEGNRENIKITTAFDLEIAEIHIKHN